MLRGAALALLCAALAHAHKRAEMSASPFVLVSRYGRAPRVLPRNDRFFMTGRYGKRSDVPPLAAAGLALELARDRDRLSACLSRERERLRAGAARDRDRLSAPRERDNQPAGSVRERDRLRAGIALDKDGASPWRTRCRCEPYAAPSVALSKYYKRTPEVADSSPEGL